MKFENKYLIRWGIPGWVFSMWLFIYLFICFDEMRVIINGNSNSLKLFSVFVTLAGIGVPVGYLFHQIYFSFEWVRKGERFLFIKKKKKPTDLDPIIEKISKKFPKWLWSEKSFIENYYYIEYIWQKELLILPEDRRNYLTERYRHFLSVIHGLGSLIYSLGTSLVIGIIIRFNPVLIDGPIEKWIIDTFIVIHMAFMLLVFINSKYFSKNLINFQAEFLNEMIFGHKLHKKV